MISEQQAITIARAHAESNGWPWADTPLFTSLDRHETKKAWFVTTHPDAVWIANVHVAVDAETGDVLHSSCREAVRNPIDANHALEVARELVLRNGYSWEDVEVFEDEFETEDGQRVNCWSICTQAGRMGGNVQIAIDAESGEVLEALFVNR